MGTMTARRLASGPGARRNSAMTQRYPAAMTHPHRRGFLTAASALAAAAPRPGLRRREADAYASSPFRKLTDADWRKKLPVGELVVLRQEDTERPGTSPLLNEHRKGTFVCLGCDLPLFSSERSSRAAPAGPASTARCPAPCSPRPT